MREIEVTMAGSNLAQEFLERIDREEAVVCRSLAIDTLGLGLLTAIKEFDFYFYNFIRAAESEMTQEHFYLMRLGLPRLIEKLLENVPRFRVPVVTFKSDALMIKGALEIVARFGFMEHGRRMCYASLAGECTMRKIDDTLYEFCLPETLYNYEATEAHVEAHYQQQMKETREELFNELLAKDNLSQHIEACFRDNVYVFHQNFIGYEAHPDLDEFFFGYAYTDLLNRSAVDVFHFDLVFGGLKYLHYTLCLAYLLSIAMKHERFCEALMQKHPEIRLRDVLTVTADRDPFIADLETALNYYGPRFEGYTPINRSQAEQLYKVFSVGRGNLRLLQSSVMNAPCLVEYSDSAVVKTISGTQLDSGEFLLQALRLHYPTEYDVNQQTRERSMQKALERILTGSFSGVKFRRNLKLRLNGLILTDVDFIAIDETDGTVLFFQLKYQDHYHGDLRKRSSRGARLRSETEEWLRSSERWLKSVETKQIRTALQLRRHVPINRVYMVAIGKKFAHFLAPLAANEDFAYSNWTQFYDSVVRLSSAAGRKTLAALFSVLRAYMTHKVAIPQQIDEEITFHLDTLSFQIVQQHHQ
jgi:hypothetical protein